MKDRHASPTPPERNSFASMTRRSWFASLFFPFSFLMCRTIPESNRKLAFTPARFEVPGVTGPLRVLVLGDFGWGGKGQMAVAKSIARIHAQAPLHFGITVGDNFYQDGVYGVDDKKWAERWEAPYAELGLVFYPTLGNHDYYGNVQAQLDYQSPSKTWHFPARQYEFRVGDTAFFALDTLDPNPEQIRWFADAFASSDAKCKIVYGHHPIYSAGKHGDTPWLEKELLPLIRGKAVAYVAGHDHDMQHLKPVDGTHFLVSGGGGARLRQPKRDPRSLFGEGIFGFTVLEINDAQVDVVMYDGNGDRIYNVGLSNPQQLEAQTIPVEGWANVPLVPAEV